MGDLASGKATHTKIMTCSEWPPALSSSMALVPGSLDLTLSAASAIFFPWRRVL